MNAAALTAALKEESFRLGFDLAGATPAVTPPGFDHFQQWLADGRAGQMHYLADRLDAYRHPDRVLEGARSLLMLGTNYRTVEPAPAGAGQARVSRYAWGADYHEMLRRRLDRLADLHRRLRPGAGVRGVVDTAPLAGTASLAAWPAWVGSARIRCLSIRAWAVGFSWPPCSARKNWSMTSRAASAAADRAAPASMLVPPARW